ncbi:Uncharacterised protein [Mycobacteroides abscessus subsp. abscessus]|nr:Uncharacterised protein [Mycobacteroides abscessus subsp. abscessus]
MPVSLTTSPPKVTAICRSTASLPSLAWWVVTWTASSAQSAMETTVRRAASSNTNSTFSAYVPLPR